MANACRSLHCCSGCSCVCSTRCRRCEPARARGSVASAVKRRISGDCRNSFAAAVAPFARPAIPGHARGIRDSVSTAGRLPLSRDGARLDPWRKAAFRAGLEGSAGVSRDGSAGQAPKQRLGRIQISSRVRNWSCFRLPRRSRTEASRRSYINRSLLCKFQATT